MSASDELEPFELRALELGLTGSEIRLAHDMGITLEEMHDLKFNPRGSRRTAGIS